MLDIISDPWFYIRDMLYYLLSVVDAHGACIYFSCNDHHVIFVKIERHAMMHKLCYNDGRGYLCRFRMSVF